MDLQVSKIVEEIVLEDLNQRFADEFVFSPILVEPDSYLDGEEYLKILIVFDGDQKLLDPNWTLGMIRRITPKLEAEGIEEFPSPSFVEKSEWLTHHRSR